MKTSTCWEWEKFSQFLCSDNSKLYIFLSTRVLRLSKDVNIIHPNPRAGLACARLGQDVRTLSTLKTLYTSKCHNEAVAAIAAPLHKGGASTRKEHMWAFHFKKILSGSTTSRRMRNSSGVGTDVSRALAMSSAKPVSSATAWAVKPG